MSHSKLWLAFFAGAGAVARAAVKSGLLDLTLDLEIARQVDILGCVYTMMRGHTARAARGEFYTPPAVAEMMARMSVLGLEPGQSVCEPAAGTGGLLRAAASALRAEGRDPGDFVWYGCDISPVAVAGLAVNAHIWGLGRQVVIGCADSLAEPDWEVRALREQREAIEAHCSRVKTIEAIAAVRALVAGGPPREGAPAQFDPSRRPHPSAAGKQAGTPAPPRAGAGGDGPDPGPGPGGLQAGRDAKRLSPTCNSNSKTRCIDSCCRRCRPHEGIEDAYRENDQPDGQAEQGTEPRRLAADPAASPARHRLHAGDGGSSDRRRH